MKRLGIALSFYFCLSFVTLAKGGALNLYLRSYAFLDRPFPLLKELVFNVTETSVDSSLAGTSKPVLPALADEAVLDNTTLALLNTSLDKLPVAKLSLVPVRHIRQALDNSQAASFILIGQRIALIPTGSYPQPLLIFYKELLLYLNTLDNYQDGRIELEITKLPAILESQSKSSAANDVVHNVEFKVLDVERQQDYLSGEATILCTFPSFADGRGNLKTNALQEKKDSTLRCTINQYVPAASLKQAAKKGDTIGSAQLDSTEINIALFDDEFIKAGNNEQGRFYLKKDAPRGTILKKTDIEPSPGVKAGEEVRLTFSRGSINLQMPGRAYSSGKTGEEVTVGYVTTQKKFKGTVTDTREVRVVIE